MQLTDILHLLLCNKPHINDMMQIVERKDGYCYYYLENDIAGGDTMPDHSQWVAITKQFISTAGFKDEKEALVFVRDVISISQQIQGICKSHPKRISFIKTIL